MKRTNNRSKIARFIWDRGEVSKLEIARGLGLSMPTVLSGVNELLDQGVAVEVGEYESTGGRKAKAIALNPGRHHAAGVDITGNHIGFVLVDFQGKLVRHERIRRRYEDSLNYYEELSSVLEQFVDGSGVSRDSILGVGVALPGILDRNHRELVRSHILNVRNVHLSRISQCIRYPVKFENDANSALSAELGVQNEDARKSVLYLSLSDTVGGALWLNGSLYAGDSSRAGEFGHMILEKNGKLCYCGKRGCADAYLSAHVLSSHTGDSLEQFFERLDQGDEEICSVWEEYLDYLAAAVTNLRMIGDCDVILGGYVGACMGPYLRALSRKAAEYNIFENDASFLRICRTRQEASAVGIALEFIKDYLGTL